MRSSKLGQRIRRAAIVGHPPHSTSVQCQLILDHRHLLRAPRVPRRELLGHAVAQALAVADQHGLRVDYARVLR
eukprot:13831011-Alexandrium_andersonii.AAC.1